MEQKVNLLDFTLEELSDYIVSLGYEKYRAKQIFAWLYKGVKNFSEMTNIKKDLRLKLEESSYIGKLEIVNQLVSKIDGTIKYLLMLQDSNVIECVLMKYIHGLTVCISSQVGCKMGCSFCASTKTGFDRNLSAGELIDQIITIQKDVGKRISNVVLMGIGEPLDNYDNVIKFLRILNDENGLNIGFRHISLSTCGIVPKILKLAKQNIPLTLSISLHAPNDELRSQLMPINKKYCIDKLIEACKIYTRKTKRRITFEYALINKLNDTKENALMLVNKIKGMLCHVNLIPVNTIEGEAYVKSSRENIENFKNILKQHKIEATIRRELGSDIAAACGQLRRSLKEVKPWK